MELMLDSSVCIAVMRDRPLGSRRLPELWSATSVAISSIVLAELEVGACQSTRPAAARMALDELLENLVVVPFDTHPATHYGWLRAKLEAEGRMIGPLDFLIAAHALALDLPLMTGNVREFKRVPGLKVIPLPKA